MSDKKLLPRQEKFCNYVLIGMSGKTAAIKAGYSKKSAKQQACDLMGLPLVQEYLQEHTQRRGVEAKIERQCIIKKLVELTKVDPTDAFDDQWNLREKAEIPRKIKRTLASVKVWQSEQGKSVSVRFITQLDAITRYLKLIPEQADKAEDLGEAAEQAEIKLEELLRKIESE